MGPRKIILNVISKITAQQQREIPKENENSEHEKTIQSILADEPKLQRMLKLLTAGSIPATNELLKMNRVLTKFYFERMILEEKRYPSWGEKQELAIKIIEAFPQLEKTRVSANAPRESYFFWRNKGLGKGPHSGIIETRVSNMRKDLPSEERLFQRPKQTIIVLPDGIQELASYVATLTPSLQNVREISEKMSQCTILHQWLLRETDVTNSLIKTFPHFLAYNGLMVSSLFSKCMLTSSNNENITFQVQQAFERLHPNAIKDCSMDSFMQLGILMEKNEWNVVEDVNIRGALRFLKKLTHCGIKRKMEEDMTIEEFLATPLIRWVKVENTTNLIATRNHVHTHPDLPPHIVCCAETFKTGDVFVVFADHIIPCGNSGDVAIDVLMKLFPVLGIDVPVLLKKLYDLIAINLWEIKQCSTSTKVSQLTLRLKEFMSAIRCD
ncbi:uncharacterized protein LOC134205370 isoform X1 [Armigeres subalbatus]|uniref:uncharacterized protein LOC134205370 isoform X1 n=1 Tax=Armigeres subalbatus TaxID=124917 RepID=UPI002ED2911F